MPDKNPPAFPPGDFLCEKPHVAGTLWTGQVVDRLLLPISVFSHRPWFSCQLFAKSTCWQATRKRQTPRTGQAAARLISLIPASSSGPADREDFCRQCASDSPIWIAAVTSAEMVYHRAALPLADAESFCRISFSPAGFLYRKRTGPKACPFLNRWEKIDQ